MSNITRRPPWGVVPRIGAMRESVALQADTQTTSTGTGFRTSSWATYATVSAEHIEPSGGSEGFQAGAVVAGQGPTFRIRYRADVLPKHRVLWRGLTLAIVAVIPVFSVGPRFLELQCSLAQ